MIIDKRLEKLEQQPEYHPPALVMVVRRQDGLFINRHFGRIYTQEELAELAANGTRIMVFDNHRPARRR